MYIFINLEMFYVNYRIKRIFEKNLIINGLIELYSSLYYLENRWLTWLNDEFKLSFYSYVNVFVI